MDGVVLPALDGHEGELRVLADRDLDGLGEGGRARVIEHDRAPGPLLGPDEDVLGGGEGRGVAGALTVIGSSGAADAHAHGALGTLTGGESDDGGLPEAGPGDDAGAVDGLAGDSQTGVVAGGGLHAHALGGVHVDGGRSPLRRAGGDGVEVEQGGEAFHRSEAPLLLSSVRGRDIRRVEGRGPVGP